MPSAPSNSVTAGEGVSSSAALRGVGYAVGYDPALSVAQMADQMKAAEAAGASMGFFSETFYTNRDSVTALATFAGRTTTMALGATQVVRLRSPLLMAQTLATLDELSGGRMVLVVGAATQRHSVRNGLKPQVRPETPPRTLREYLTVIRMLLTGEPVTFHGDVVVLDDVALNWRPIRADVPIWLAGASELGLRIAGELADGILLDAGKSPEYTANALRIVRAARESVGRSMDDFGVAQLINTSIEGSKADAIAAVKWEIASKFKFALTTNAMVKVGDPNIDPADPDRLARIFQTAGLDALLAALPDSYVDALSASGTAEQVRERIASYRAAGVTMPLVRPAHASQVPSLLSNLRTFGAAG